MEMSQMNGSEMRKESNSGIDLYIETAPNVKLYVKDYGQGKPVIRKRNFKSGTYIFSNPFSITNRFESKRSSTRKIRWNGGTN